MLNILARRVASERIVVITFTFSLLGTALLTFFSVPEVVEVDLEDISEEYIGLNVHTEGRIKDINKGYRQGEIVIVLLDIDSTASIMVYVKERCISYLSEEERKQLGNGCVISVEGKVSKYKGSYQMAVEKIDGLKVIQAAEYPISISTVLSMPSVYEGMNITFIGKVMEKRLIANYKMKYVTDGANFIWVYVENGKNVYGSVDVSGMFFYDEEKGRWCIKVSEGTTDKYAPHPSTFSAGYENITLDELLSTPQVYDGMLVSISSLRVLLHEELIGTSFVLREDDYYAHCMLFSSSTDLDKYGKLWNSSSIVQFTGKFIYYANAGEWQLTAHSNENIILIN